MTISCNQWQKTKVGRQGSPRGFFITEQLTSSKNLEIGNRPSSRINHYIVSLINMMHRKDKVFNFQVVPYESTRETPLQLMLILICYINSLTISTLETISQSSSGLYSTWCSLFRLYKPIVLWMPRHDRLIRTHQWQHKSAQNNTYNTRNSWETLLANFL